MKSPLKGKPLNNPGDSLQKAIDDLFFDRVILYFLAAVIFAVIACVDWYRYSANIPINPWHFTTAAIASGLLLFYKVWYARKISRNLKQGRDGEKVVGQFLESLRETGAKVFHDIPGDNFNLDHVVIAASGIYLIETKTYSKPDKGEPTITFDGEKVTLRERGSYSEPVTQVQAGAYWLRELSHESTGKRFQIRPVLVFPGWFVQPTAEARSSEVWVLNPKALPAFIQNSRHSLAIGEINMVAMHLSRYIQGCTK